MGAITFDLSIKALREQYTHKSISTAYQEIKKTLKKHGFESRQGSVYFGNELADSSRATVACLDLIKSHSGFLASVKDIRILKVDKNNNIGPLLKGEYEFLVRRVPDYLTQSKVNQLREMPPTS